MLHDTIKCLAVFWMYDNLFRKNGTHICIIVRTNCQFEQLPFPLLEETFTIPLRLHFFHLLELESINKLYNTHFKRPLLCVIYKLW